MAKSKAFFGLRRGSTKSFTFQVLDGKQITKDRVSEVRNPRTEKQTYQRLIFATVAQATKLLKPIINHSFENKAYGEASVRHFRSINMQKVRALAAAEYNSSESYEHSKVFLTKKGVSQLIPNSYIIADGSLAKPIVNIFKQSSGVLDLEQPVVKFGFSGTEESGEKYVTLGSLFSNILGLRDNNEQLSLVTINRANASGDDPSLYAYAFEADAPGEAIAYTAFSALRVFIDQSVNMNEHIILTDDQGTLLEAPESIIADALTGRLAISSESDTAFVDMLNALLSSGNAEIEDGVLAVGGATIGLNGFFENADGAGHVYAAGLVRSRLEGTKWLRSRTELTLATPTLTNNFGLIMQFAYAADQEGSVVGSDNWFLNGGGEEDQIGESFT